MAYFMTLLGPAGGTTVVHFGPPGNPAENKEILDAAFREMSYAPSNEHGIKPTDVAKENTPLRIFATNCPDHSPNLTITFAEVRALAATLPSS